MTDADAYQVPVRTLHLLLAIYYLQKPFCGNILRNIPCYWFKSLMWCCRMIKSRFRRWSMSWMRRKRRHWRPHGRKWTSEKDSLLSHLQLYNELVWLCLFVHCWGHSIRTKISVRQFLLLNVFKSTIGLPDLPLIVSLSASAGVIIVWLGFTWLQRFTVCLIDWNHLTCACSIDDKEDSFLKKQSLFEFCCLQGLWLNIFNAVARDNG